MRLGMFTFLLVFSLQLRAQKSVFINPVFNFQHIYLYNSPLSNSNGLGLIIGYQNTFSKRFGYLASLSCLNQSRLKSSVDCELGSCRGLNINKYKENPSFTLESSLKFYPIPHVLWLKVGGFLGYNKIIEYSGVSYGGFWKSDSPNKKENVEFISERGLDKGFCLGSGLEIPLSKKLDLLVNIDYRFASIKSDVTITVDGVPTSFNYRFSYKIFMPGLGLSYQLK